MRPDTPTSGSGRALSSRQCVSRGAARAYSVDVKTRLAFTACLVVLVFPAGAVAASCAPPGNSGVQQYLETVPGAGCNKPTSGSSGHHGGGGSLAPSTRRRLAGQGATGQAVERLVATTAPGATGSATGPTGGRRRTTGSPGPSKSAPPAADAGSGAVGGALHPILTGASSGGLGVLLPVFLAGALAVITAAALLRRRRSTS
jgi:hypothetical protein